MLSQESNKTGYRSLAAFVYMTKTPDYDLELEQIEEWQFNCAE